jgi:uncharacterized lipoprotein YehR (DUF1307 family)
MKKKILLNLLVVVALFTITGCGSKEENGKENEKENKSIVISNVDKDTRWEAITNYDITLEF